MDNWEDGFLTETLDDVCKMVRGEYTGYRTLLRRVNRYAVSTQHAINIHVDSVRERYATCLYARTLATTQASVLLLERGLVSQAKMLARSALETLFALGAIVKEPSMVERLIDGHAAEQKRVANKMKQKKWQHPELKQIAEAEVASGRLQCFLDNKAIAPTTEQLAEKAGLGDWYHTVYMTYSGAVHGVPFDLDRHVVVGLDGRPSEFKNEPEIEGQETTWLCDIEILLKSLRFLGKIFSEVDDAIVEEMYREAHALHDKA